MVHPPWGNVADLTISVECLSANIFSIVGSLPVDTGNGVIGTTYSFFDVIAQCGDTQNATATGNHRIVFQSSSCMKHFYIM